MSLKELINEDSILNIIYMNLYNVFSEPLPSSASKFKPVSCVLDVQQWLDLVCSVFNRGFSGFSRAIIKCLKFIIFV